MPAATAGEVFSVPWTLHIVDADKQIHHRFVFAHFLLNALVSRAMRRLPIRTEVLTRSANDVLIRFMFGSPMMAFRRDSFI